MFSTAISLNNLGLAEQERGDHARAVALLKESLSLRTELGDKIGIAYCLERLAGVAVSEGRADRAACLLGGAERLREVTSAPPPPVDRAEQERCVDTARRRLDPTAFDVAWREGYAMATEQVTAYALDTRGGA